MCSRDHNARLGRGWMPPAFDLLPLAYNSRASSVRVSGDIRRPLGQFKAPDKSIVFGPEPMLDYEVELGAVLRTGNPLGVPFTVSEASEAIFGYCLLNDWSARGIQFMESQPLGPFLGKNFYSTISPWIVTAEALAPFMVAAAPRAPDAPPPPAHLWDDEDQASGNLNIVVEAFLSTAKMRQDGLPASRTVRTNSNIAYWTFAQMVAHHASNGCNLEPGDLLGSGTLSGPTDESRACLAESTERGTAPLVLPTGERRAYLEDGDEVVMRGRAEAPGAVSIGFGACSGTIVPALVRG
jgi:fumarylacetoacetase